MTNFTTLILKDFSYGCHSNNSAHKQRRCCNFEFLSQLSSPLFNLQTNTSTVEVVFTFNARPLLFGFVVGAVSFARWSGLFKLNITLIRMFLVRSSIWYTQLSRYTRHPHTFKRIDYAHFPFLFSLDKLDSSCFVANWFLLSPSICLFVSHLSWRLSLLVDFSNRELSTKTIAILVFCAYFYVFLYAFPLRNLQPNLVFGPSEKTANLTVLLEQFSDWKDQVPSYLTTLDQVNISIDLTSS